MRSLDEIRANGDQYAQLRERALRAKDIAVVAQKAGEKWVLLDWLANDVLVLADALDRANEQAAQTAKERDWWRARYLLDVSPDAEREDRLYLEATEAESQKGENAETKT